MATMFRECIPDTAMYLEYLSYDLSWRLNWKFKERSHVSSAEEEPVLLTMNARKESFVSGINALLPCTLLYNRVTQPHLFCEISVRRIKICLVFSIAWGGLKMTVPFMYNFRSLPNKFPTIFWSLILPISLTSWIHFSYRKEA